MLNYGVGETDGEGEGSAGLADGDALGDTLGVALGDTVGVGVAETLNSVAVAAEKLAAKIPDKRNKLVAKIKVVLFNTKSLLGYVINFFKQSVFDHFALLGFTCKTIETILHSN